jgi:hypothetical protein
MEHETKWRDLKNKREGGGGGEEARTGNAGGDEGLFADYDLPSGSVEADPVPFLQPDSPQ